MPEWLLGKFHRCLRSYGMAICSLLLWGGREDEGFSTYDLGSFIDCFIDRWQFNRYRRGCSSLGDINADGSINASDALMVLQYSVSIRTLDSDQRDRADVNGDGDINANDALLILQYSVGLISAFERAQTTSMPWSESTTVYAQQTEAIPTNPIRTTFQQSGGYRGGDGHPVGLGDGLYQQFRLGGFPPSIPGKTTTSRDAGST